MGPHKPPLMVSVCILGSIFCVFEVPRRPNSDPVGVNMVLGGRGGLRVSRLCLAGEGGRSVRTARGIDIHRMIESMAYLFLSPMFPHSYLLCM